MRNTKIAQYARYLAADIAVPFMRLTGFRFSKASRDSRLINSVIERVYANLKADHIEVQKLIW